MLDFERELGSFRQRSRRDVKSVGTKEEIQTLRQDTEKMNEFLRDIRETTQVMSNF